MLIKNLTSRLVNGKMGTVVDFLPGTNFKTYTFVSRSTTTTQCNFRTNCIKTSAKATPSFASTTKRSPVLVTYEEFDAVEGDKDDVRVDYCKVTRTQIPLVVHSPWTVHKCQVMSLPVGQVLRIRVFTPGQVYVAFSRCTSLEGLQIIALRPN